jgi:hypothetical protein
MIAVAGEILDADLGVGKALLDHPRDIVGRHGHKPVSFVYRHDLAPSMKRGNQRSWALHNAYESGRLP